MKMMQNASYHPWLHRLAWLTAIIALLPIGFGAVVTTVDAGMAFADWPTSDGQGMFAYPWLKSTGDQFLEHGHRLAGMLVGAMSLVLAGVAFGTPTRRDLRTVTVAIVAGVIVQGMLGGWRVVADERVVAMIHGIFAALVFSLMGVLVAMSGRRWSQQTLIEREDRGRVAVICGIVSLVLMSCQYVLGGWLRHLGASFAWLAHPWFAIAVVAGVLVWFISLWRTGTPSLKRAGSWVLAMILAQAALGVMTWAVRYGYPQWGVMAVQQSSLQVSVRSLHKVLGLLTYMSMVVALVRTMALLPSTQQWAELASMGSGASRSNMGGAQ